MAIALLLALLLALGIGACRHALGRYESMLRQGGRERAPTAHTGAEIARLYLESEGVDDVKVVTHDSTVTNYFDASRRQLCLSPAMADGTSMAAWAVALHEAGHATQIGDAAAELHWRQTVITLCRYGPMFGMFGAGALLLLMRMNIRVVLILFTALCAILFLLNVGTLAVERNANARLRRFLDRHLDRQPTANERLTKYLGAVASRDLGDLLRSPRYFLFSALPGTGKLRPSGKGDH